MAIQVNYEFGGDFYPNTYIKVQKIVLTTSTTEKFEIQDDGTEVLKYYVTPTTSAYIFVYPDRDARLNNARPLHFFGIEYAYDADSGENPYHVAYAALKNLERFKNETIEDV